MRQSKKTIILICFLAGISCFAQDSSVGEMYQRTYPIQNGGVIEYTLSLQPDGTFDFHFYRNIICGTCVEENYFGKGSWSTEKNVYYFKSEATHLDEKYTLSLNNSKARSNKPSPRNKSPKIKKEAIRFYASEISWIKGMELFKVQ